MGSGPLKLKGGKADPADDLERVARVREAVGSRKRSWPTPISDGPSTRRSDGSAGWNATTSSGSRSRVCHLAEAVGLRVAPHVSPELSVTVAAAVPNSLFIEFIPQMEPVLARRARGVVGGPPGRGSRAAQSHRGRGALRRR
jgi:L-alanine-DL-glutamate epimerase-like enolase superfamily enzyme